MTRRGGSGFRCRFGSASRTFGMTLRKTNTRGNEARPTYVPSGLSTRSVRCAKCGTTSPMPWAGKTKAAPVAIAGTRGTWAPMTWDVKCPRCGESIEVSLPHAKHSSTMNFYGDDASREYNGRRVFIYSLVGTDRRAQPTFEDDLARIKERFLPGTDPHAWKLHMTELWDGKKRAKNPVFAGAGYAEVRKLVEGVFELFRSTDGLHTFAIAYVPGRIHGHTFQNDREAKRDSFMMLVNHMIFEMCAKGIKPILNFDAEKPTSARETVHAWAREAFDDDQHKILYAFLSQGILVPEPVFLKPGSHSLLELADFVSFWLGRCYHCAWKGVQPEYDLSLLGKATYLGVDLAGFLRYISSDGYPWKEMNGSV